MHANLDVTDSNYSILNEGDVKERISKLGKEQEQEDIRTMLAALIAKVDGLSYRF